MYDQQQKCIAQQGSSHDRIPHLLQSNMAHWFPFMWKINAKIYGAHWANEDAAPPGILVNVDALAKESTIKRGHPGLK